MKVKVTYITIEVTCKGCKDIREYSIKVEDSEPVDMGEESVCVDNTIYDFLSSLEDGSAIDSNDFVCDNCWQDHLQWLRIRDEFAPWASRVWRAV